MSTQRGTDSTRHGRGVRAAALGLLGTVGVGCLSNEGIAPPHAELHFPIALALVDAEDDASDAPTHLVVANTNFDLAYNASTLVSFDLAALEGSIAASCTGREGGECALVPTETGESARDLGRVRVVPTTGLLESEALIGSYAEGIALGSNDRTLYVPVRGEGDITRVQVAAGGALDCGGTTGLRTRCAASARESSRDEAASRGESLPIEMLDLVAGPLSDFGSTSVGDYVVTSHRTGDVSVFIADTPGGPLELVDVASYGSVQFETLAFDPVGRRFLLPTANGGIVSRGSLTLDEGTGDLRTTSFARTGAYVVSGLDSGTGTPRLRQVVPDVRPARAAIGGALLVAINPPALLSVHVEPNDSTYAIDAVMPLGVSPMRAVVGDLAGHPIAVVSCYGSRDVYVYEVDTHELLAVIRGFSGPFDLAIDVERERLYVDDFRVSVVHVVDLAPLRGCLELSAAPATEPACAPRSIGMIGIPTSVEELR